MKKMIWTAGLFAITFPAVAGAVEICADLDGDGIAEACIVVEDGQAHFPGQAPPPVPPVPPFGS